MDAPAPPAAAPPASLPPVLGLASARAPFREALLVCGKCARKLDGGFGRKGRKALRTELKRAWKAAERPGKLRVAETACLGLCPKHRQAVATAASLAAGRLWVVAPGADVATVLARLLPPPPPPQG